MNAEVRRALETLKQDAGDKEHLFSSARTGVNLTEIKKGFRSACLVAGIPYGQRTPGGLIFHDLRHTFATRLGEREPMSQRSWRCLVTPASKWRGRYTHATPETMQDAVNALESKPSQMIEFKRKLG